MSWDDCAFMNWEDCKFVDTTDNVWDKHSTTYYSGQEYDAKKTRTAKVTMVRTMDTGRKPYMEANYPEMMREFTDKHYRR